jgi:hypothetical protein
VIVVDRIEEDIAVLEVDGETIDVPLAQLPAGITEGQVLEGDGDNSATGPTREVVERMKRLRMRDPGDMEIDI